MHFFSADKDFLVTGVRMMMPVTLFHSADQSFYLSVAGIAVHMLGELTDQISVCVKTPIVGRMLMFRNLTVKFPAHLIAAVIMMMAIALFLAADQPFFIAFITVLVLFNSAGRIQLKRDCRQDQCISRDKYNER